MAGCTRRRAARPGDRAELGPAGASPAAPRCPLELPRAAPRGRSSQVLAVNHRESDAAIRRFIDETALTLPVLRDADRRRRAPGRGRLPQHHRDRPRRPRALQRARRTRLDRPRGTRADRRRALNPLTFSRPLEIAMTHPLTRRQLLERSALAAAAPLLPLQAFAQERRFEPPARRLAHVRPRHHRERRRVKGTWHDTPVAAHPRCRERPAAAHRRTAGAATPPARASWPIRRGVRMLHAEFGPLPARRRSR